MLKSQFILFFVFFFVLSFAFSENKNVIKLPKPQKNIGKPLMEALSLRHSSREFNIKLLPLQEISNILWAANGINRIENYKRTAPSAMNWQEIDIFVIMEKGAYIYDARENSLIVISNKDLRSFAGTQDFVKTAPQNLLYVADFKKLGKSDNESTLLNVGADAGFFAQNVYLYCASQGLECVVRASIKKDETAKALNLRPDQKIILGQTIGYSK